MILLFLSAPNADARMPGDPKKASFDLSVTLFQQASVDVDGGGEFKQSNSVVRLNAKRSVSPTTTVGLSLKYDEEDYAFSGTSGFAGAQPWNDVRRIGLSISFFTRLPNSWSVGVSPSVDWVGEHGADNGDSVSYGLTAFALRSWARDKSLGLGGGLFKTIDDDVRGFPFLSVDWRFNERWRLANPFDADALGPAGLELIYRFDDRWRLGAGAVYRSVRFRLDEEGIAPKGIGENRGVVGFLRLRRLALSGINIDLYAGAILNGRLELKNSNGNDIASSDYDTAPFAAATLRMAF